MNINEMLNIENHEDDEIRPPTEGKKDELVLAQEPLSDPVFFPPHEAPHFSEISRQHDIFKLWPRRNFKEHSNYFPYQGTVFREMTLRSGFRVCGYEITARESTVQSERQRRSGVATRPPVEKRFPILWDYQIGLVRMTSIYKASGHEVFSGKTLPQRILNQNGLESCTPSVTGGAIVAQGYWLPYHAARAIAAQFAWNIRYALTPLFGNDFPDICVQATEFSRNPSIIIDAKIVQDAIATQKDWVKRPKYYGETTTSQVRENRNHFKKRKTTLTDLKKPRRSTANPSPSTTATTHGNISDNDRQTKRETTSQEAFLPIIVTTPDTATPSGARPSRRSVRLNSLSNGNNYSRSAALSTAFSTSRSATVSASTSVHALISPSRSQRTLPRLYIPNTPESQTYAQLHPTTTTTTTTAQYSHHTLSPLSDDELYSDSWAMSPARQHRASQGQRLPCDHNHDHNHSHCHDYKPNHDHDQDLQSQNQQQHHLRKPRFLISQRAYDAYPSSPTYHPPPLNRRVPPTAFLLNSPPYRYDPAQSQSQIHTPGETEARSKNETEMGAEIHTPPLQMHAQTPTPSHRTPRLAAHQSHQSHRLHGVFPSATPAVNLNTSTATNLNRNLNLNVHSTKVPARVQDAADALLALSRYSLTLGAGTLVRPELVHPRTRGAAGSGIGNVVVKTEQTAHMEQKETTKTAAQTVQKRVKNSGEDHNATTPQPAATRSTRDQSPRNQLQNESPQDLHRQAHRPQPQRQRSTAPQHPPKPLEPLTLPAITLQSTQSEPVVRRRWDGGAGGVGGVGGVGGKRKEMKDWDGEAVVGERDGGEAGLEDEMEDEKKDGKESRRPAKRVRL